jgi:dienelactone hydrolase
MKDLSADPAAAYTAITAALGIFASQSGNPQLGQVPLLLFGHSAGGCLAYKITRLHSARVIGFLSGKGGCHEPHDAGILGALSVPGYFFIGEDDEPSRAANITTVFEQNRAAGALWALAVEPGAAHAVIRDLGLQIKWMDAVLSRRLPASATSTTLVPINEASGWLANRSSFAIAAYAAYAGEPLQASWLPSEQTAQDWQVFVQYTDTE